MERIDTSGDVTKGANILSERSCYPMSTDAKKARWVCLECHWIYDPAKGDPKNGVPAGTSWDDVPDTWRCPECKIFKAKKGVFKRLDD
jgi:rubredoxin